MFNLSCESLASKEYRNLEQSITIYYSAAALTDILDIRT